MRTSRQSVVLPAPEGAETTKSEPRRSITRVTPLTAETQGQRGRLERGQDEVIALGDDHGAGAPPVRRVDQLGAALGALDQPLHGSDPARASFPEYSSPRWPPGTARDRPTWPRPCSPRVPATG